MALGPRAHGHRDSFWRTVAALGTSRNRMRSFSYFDHVTSPCLVHRERRSRRRSGFRIQRPTFRRTYAPFILRPVPPRMRGMRNGSADMRSMSGSNDPRQVGPIAKSSGRTTTEQPTVRYVVLTLLPSRNEVFFPQSRLRPRPTLALPSGREVGRLEGHTVRSFDVAFHPDGRLHSPGPIIRRSWRSGRSHVMMSSTATQPTVVPSMTTGTSEPDLKSTRDAYPSDCGPE